MGTSVEERSLLTVERVRAASRAAAFARLFVNTTEAAPLEDLSQIQRWIWRDLCDALAHLDELTSS